MEMRNVEGIDGAAQCKLGSNFPFTCDNWIIRIADENIISHCLSGCQLCIIRIIYSGSDRPTPGPCHIFCFRYPRLLVGWFQILHFFLYIFCPKSNGRKINSNDFEKTFTGGTQVHNILINFEDVQYNIISSFKLTETMISNIWCRHDANNNICRHAVIIFITVFMLVREIQNY